MGELVLGNPRLWRKGAYQKCKREILFLQLVVDQEMIRLMILARRFTFPIAYLPYIIKKLSNIWGVVQFRPRLLIWLAK